MPQDASSDRLAGWAGDPYHTYATAAGSGGNGRYGVMLRDFHRTSLPPFWRTALTRLLFGRSG